jgi:sensor domain CHASE-containing protein
MVLQFHSIKTELNAIKEPIRREIHNAVKKVLRLTKTENSASRTKLTDWLRLSNIENTDRYSSHVMSQSNFQVSSCSSSCC